MILTLHTEGWFDAAHHLDNYEGACKNIHGHTYKVEVWVQGDDSRLNKAGILWDFGNLKKIIKRWDHPEFGELNNWFKCNPTAEHMAVIIFKKLKSNHSYLNFKVRIYEQIEPKKSWCECGDINGNQ